MKIPIQRGKRARGLTGAFVLWSATWVATAAVPLSGQAWSDMDYGPYLTLTLEAEKGNIAYKGIAIRLDGGEGGVAKGRSFVLFDTDNLRYAAAWSGEGFIDWRNIAFDGSHGTHAKLVGQVAFQNPVGPGWAKPSDEKFYEPRLLGRDRLPYGPMPRDWMHWKGLYLHNSRVILHYTVGRTEVLESPSWREQSHTAAWSRTIHLGPREKDMILQVARDDSGTMELRRPALPPSTHPILPVFTPPPVRKTSWNVKDGRMVFGGREYAEVQGSSDFDLTGQDFTILARIRTEAGGTIISKAAREGDWVPNGKTFFVRGGRLCYDIGWVGVVQSRTKVNDGRWHDVAAVFTAADRSVRLYVDGNLEGERELQPTAPTPDHVVRIGYTSPNFPAVDAPGWVGELEALEFHQRALSEETIGKWRKTNQPWPSPLAAYRFPSPDEKDRWQDTAGRGHEASLQVLPTQQNSRPALAVAVRGDVAGVSWIKTENGDLRLRIPSGEHSLKLDIWLATLPEDESIQGLLALLRDQPGPVDLPTLTVGGPPRWPAIVTTRSRRLGSPANPYVIEEISDPSDNPYRSWMRFGGFDFLEDGHRAAVCTWMGDVWLVDGLGGDLGEFHWKRIATGLFQPLGLKVVNETIYVTGRDQVTRLHDLNGDEEIDYYENFNNDAQVTDHFHEFAMDLQTDAKGNFYYAKGARHALDALVPQHGTLIRVSPDGSTSEIVAGGFRAPNGVCINGDGTFIMSDQEGHWTPKNRINWVVPGGFYGNMMAYHDGLRSEEAALPVTWIHNAFDRSPAEQLWVTSERWGPLSGALLNLSYGMGKIHLVLHEEIDGVRQGGVVELPISDFPTGIMRGRFHSGDGQLYVCGLVGWSSNKIKPGGFYRVRFLNRSVCVPTRLRARRSGLELTFSEALRPETAGDPGSYAVSRWQYRRTANYGSQDYKIEDPNQTGRDDVEIAAAELSADGRTILLRIPDMRPAMQMQIQYRLRTAGGKRISQIVQNTVHVLGD